jgi:hypothetical protein
MPVEYWFKQVNGEPRAVTAIVRLRGWGTAFAHRDHNGRWVADSEPQGVHPEIAARVEEILN